ncbi:MAG: 50S ribosomal protein L29 [Candidatus Pacebacteria bacterium]|nr:50S ribosomal protein L29 [Candidatus Paceibacterota bacterium]PIR60524.1 MAG: 50S ribosomal protein L29 [Candidatus Pacebacteria bacterium CG10_big_fil_rev_8_21_14_0_10_44_54]
MKKTDIHKLHELESAELTTKLAALRKSFISLRMQKFAGKLANTAQVTHLAKDIARVLTVLREKEKATT